MTAITTVRVQLVAGSWWIAGSPPGDPPPPAWAFVAWRIRPPDFRGREVFAVMGRVVMQ